MFTKKRQRQAERERERETDRLTETDRQNILRKYRRMPVIRVRTMFKCLTNHVILTSKKKKNPVTGATFPERFYYAKGSVGRDQTNLPHWYPPERTNSDLINNRYSHQLCYQGKATLRSDIIPGCLPCTSIQSQH